MRPGFEGGQLPLIKRLPRKRGFTNIFRTNYSIANLGSLNVFEAGSEVTAKELVAAGVVKSRRQPIKVLAGGDLDRPLILRVNGFSAAAKAKIEAAGGKAEEVEFEPEAI
jgi:large subunit ribosomal protein L15